MIDYEILRAIWWLFIGVLLVGFAIAGLLAFGPNMAMTGKR